MEEGKAKMMQEGCEDGATRANKTEDGATRKKRRHNDFKHELVELILRRVQLVDRKDFRLVCRIFYETEKQGLFPQHPWLMLKHCKKMQQFYSLIEGATYWAKLPELSQLNCMASCRGWLLLDCMASCRGWLLVMHDCSQIWFLLNPVRRKKIAVPKVNSLTSSVRHKFLVADPTSPNNVIVVLSGPKSIWIFQPSLKPGWEEKMLPAQGPRGCSNVIACNSMLYLLDFDLKLAVVDPCGGEPMLLELNGSLLASKVFLVESSGEILLVCAENLLDKLYDEDGRQLYRFKVFKAKLDPMEWEEVKSLDNRILFLSERSCFSISLEDGAKGNQILFLPPYPEEFNYWIDFNLDNGIPLACRLPDNLRGCQETWQWLSMPSLG